MDSESSDFFDHMESIKPPHENDVLSFFSIVKHADVEDFAKKLEDEKTHNETLAAQQLEDINKLEASIDFAVKKVSGLDIVECKI